MIRFRGARLAARLAALETKLAPPPPGLPRRGSLLNMSDVAAMSPATCSGQTSISRRRKLPIARLNAVKRKVSRISRPASWPMVSQAKYVSCLAIRSRMARAQPRLAPPGRFGEPHERRVNIKMPAAGIDVPNSRRPEGHLGAVDPPVFCVGAFQSSSARVISSLLGSTGFFKNIQSLLI